MRTATPLVTLIPLLALSACGTPNFNARSTLGGVQIVPALTPDTGDLASLEGARLTRIDRADWAPIDYVAPFDGVAHPPIWRSYSRHTTSQPRAAGVAPTIETALDLPRDQGWRVLTETTWAHVVAFVDIPLIIPRAIIDPVNQPNVSPGILYSRSVPGAWRAGPTPKREPESLGADAAQPAEGTDQ
ncbi:MAG: hypothetical protein AAGI53_15570 [Planctomycetota bacterium]